MQVRLDASRRAYDRMLAAFKKGVLSDADAEEMLPRLREARASREHEWTMISVAPPVIALHPTLIAEYLRHVDALRASLSIYGRQGDEPTDRLVAAFRAVVQSVTIHPDAPHRCFEVT